MRYLLLLIFIPAFCHGQDTIVTRSGRKIVAKIKGVNNYVYFKYKGDTSKLNYFIETYHVQYIRYSNGTKEFYNLPWTDKTKDTVLAKKQLPMPSIVFNAGVGIPIGSYGATSCMPYGTYYNIISGYAKTGESFSLVLDIPINLKGWSFLLKGGELIQPIDIRELMNGMQKYFDYNVSVNTNITGYSGSNNYYYRHLLLLAGLSKSFKTAFSTITIRAMAGDLAFDMPTIEGTVFYNSIYNNSQEVYTLNGGTTNMLAFDMGILVEQTLNKHFSIRESIDCIASWNPFDCISTAIPNFSPWPNDLWDNQIQDTEILTAEIGLKYTF